MPIGSVLKAAINAMPDSMKAESVAPLLLKKGVKQEELEFSELAIPTTGKVTKEQMLDAEAKRADKFYTTELKGSDTMYGRITLDSGIGNPTYREKVLSFRRQDQEEAITGQRWIDGSEKSRYTSEHFPEQEDYLMHTRIYDDMFEGSSSRMLLEIQSDLHQTGRQVGYEGSGPSADAIHEEFKVFGESLGYDRNYLDEISMDDLAANLRTKNPEAAATIDEMASKWTAAFEGGNVPKSPFEKTWLRKGIERELSDAIDEGRQQLVIPISGGETDSLMRSEGVQKWYETQVFNTAKKVAKQTNSDFIIKEVGGTPLDEELVKRYTEVQQRAQAYLRETDEETAEGLRDFVDDGIVKLQSIASHLDFEDMTYEDFSYMGVRDALSIEDVAPTKYAIIRPKGGTLEQVIPEKAIQDILDIPNHNPSKPVEGMAKPFEKEEKLLDLGLTRAEVARLMSGRSTAKEIADRELVTRYVTKPNVNLYTSPAAGAFVAYQAYQMGMSKEEVEKKLMEDYGYDAEDLAEVSSRVGVIADATAANMPMEEIKAKMKGAQVVADTVQSEPPKREYAYGSLADMEKAYKENDRLNKLADPDEVYTPEELISSLKVLKPTLTSDLLTTIPAWFGSKEPLQRYTAAREASRKQIIDITKRDYGMDLVWDDTQGVGNEDWYVNTPEGYTKVTPGFWEELRATDAEIGLGVLGAIKGGKMAFESAPVTLPLVGPLSKPLASLFGAATGGWLGSLAGSQVDYLREAVELNADMEAEVMAYKALNASELAAIGEVAALPINMLGSLFWKGIVVAKQSVINKDYSAAKRALKDAAFLDNAQIDEIINALEPHMPLDANKTDKGIRAVALTEPGMEHLVKAAADINPKVGAIVTDSVTKRAEDVLSNTANLTDEQVPRILMSDLQNYSKDVKAQYDKVKSRATQTPYGQNFSWDFEELAIQPVLEKQLKSITDPATKEKFLLQMQRVNTLSESRSFGDLLELRQMVNDFMYNRNIVKADDKHTIRGVLNNIDAAIEDGASSVLENPKQWLDDWANARKEYSQMKQVEKTALYRVMFNKDGTMKAVQPETVVKALGKHITSLDGSFEQLMSKLPIEGRKMYEGAVIDALANRYAIGDINRKAINFPMLADELQKITLTTPDARAAKKALIELGEVFKNDVYLAQISGKIAMPKFMQGLSDNLVSKAKFEAAARMYSYIKTQTPSKEGRDAALIRATARLLENPLDSKNFKVLQDEVYGDANLSASIREMQQAAARNRAKEIDIGTPRVYLDSSGKIVKKSGMFIPAHRILTVKQAQEIAETESITLDSKILDTVLKKYGYKAILQGSDRVRILGDK